MTRHPSREEFAVCVGGVPGVGKTTLLRRHVAQVETRDRAISGSSILGAVIAPTDFDEFDGWPEPQRVAAREEAIRRLEVERRTTPGRLLVDGHYTLRSRRDGQLAPVFTLADRRFYAAIVLVEGTVAEVRAWRGGDPRNRGPEDPATIQEHLAAERLEALRLAREMGVPYLVVPAVDQVRGVRILSEFLNRQAPFGGRT
ncbi:MAG: AAA family ATPase [Thermoplasmata archaeon]